MKPICVWLDAFKETVAVLYNHGAHIYVFLGMIS